MGRTAQEAGWRISRYNLSAVQPGGGSAIIANLFAGTVAEYGPAEVLVMCSLDEIDEGHPLIERLARRGVIVDFDETAAIEALGRAYCGMSRTVSLTICPTTACNFDCPYCFENHGRGRMSREVQDDVVALAERMLEASCAETMQVTWFGGEPLLAPDVIEDLTPRLRSLAQAQGASFRASIVTNGYLLTQDIVDMLVAMDVSGATISLDGLGSAHDATRHLAGGGPTFERIAANLGSVRIPFTVNIRHNVHEGNLDQIPALRSYVDQLAAASGNSYRYYPTLVWGNRASDEREAHMGLLGGSDAVEVALQEAIRGFSRGRGHFCGAQNLWNIGIDDKGGLTKCWETVDKPGMAFGCARTWEPTDPLATATNPDMLTAFLNTAAPIPDGECRSCAWLPLCAGGCPNKRLFEHGRVCVPFKDDAEKFVRTLYERRHEIRKRV